MSLKRGLDDDVRAIRMTPKPITVAQLAAMPLPATFAGNLEDAPTRRVGDFERQVWRVDATITSIQLRSDGDYYLEIAGADGAQAVVEVPDPAQSAGSPLEPMIAAARKTLEDRYHPTAVKQTVDDRAVLDGVGFYGFRGRPTGGRLMPGLSVTFAAKSP